MLTKKYLPFAVILFFVVVLAGCSHETTETQTPATQNGAEVPMEEEVVEVGSYTLEEVAQHNSSEDCWTAFEGKVYDVTNYLPDHPPGADKAANACGQDISEGFTKNPVHANKGVKSLEEYYIGDLK